MSDEMEKYLEYLANSVKSMQDHARRHQARMQLIEGKILDDEHDDLLMLDMMYMSILNLATLVKLLAREREE